jgi:hypothetical protein
VRTIISVLAVLVILVGCASSPRYAIEEDGFHLTEKCKSTRALVESYARTFEGLSLSHNTWLFVHQSPECFYMEEIVKFAQEYIHAQTMFSKEACNPCPTHKTNQNWL